MTAASNGHEPSPMGKSRTDEGRHDRQQQRHRRRRVLLVDLNNYATFPTLAIGYLVASLRSNGYEVEVLSPFQHGVAPTLREGVEGRADHLQRLVQFSGNAVLSRTHDRLRTLRGRRALRPHPVVLQETEAAIERIRPDAVLISSYLEFRPSVEALGEVALHHDVPALLGGPYFNVPEVAAEWIDIPGIEAVVGAEVDFVLAGIVDDLIERRDLTRHRGVTVSIGNRSDEAAPLESIDDLPIPDLRDFPWEKYRTKIIPVMSGRGCGWGKCTFCSDVTSANGRGFRGRPADRLFEELRAQSENYGSTDFIFLDIKLNSDLVLWRAIIDRFQDEIPGGRWIGTVHVDAKGDHGLSRDDLIAARASGMLRMSFGLESGSQRLNERMSKGTKIERTSEFLTDAHAAGISVRATAMLGYPGETAADIRQTVDLIERHDGHLDRVRMSRFKAIPGTRFHRQYDAAPTRFPGLVDFAWDHRYARATYRNVDASARDYRAAKRTLLRAVHEINSRPLRDGAEEFDGLM